MQFFFPYLHNFYKECKIYKYLYYLMHQFRRLLIHCLNYRQIPIKMKYGPQFGILTQVFKSVFQLRQSWDKILYKLCDKISPSKLPHSWTQCLSNFTWNQNQNSITDFNSENTFSWRTIILTYSNTENHLTLLTCIFKFIYVWERIF